MKVEKLSVGVLWLVSAVFSTACSEQGHDVDHYKAHIEQRDQVLAKCRQDIARSKEDRACVNAAQALFEGDGVKHTPGRKY
ncbi:EexN family lipoprotein [Xanthomonas campestris pv. raphani]|uniref:EexN family lipoprotein n=1 Tax=Xanthomonas campestris TaxID=339 RepID=UPI002B22A078|nr:EexN family lipoprotein [Xanthomonas campestris]MEA9787037.1 EexN family lipoprotein [Xanthomonas campestris pv. raphani]